MPKKSIRQQRIQDLELAIVLHVVLESSGNEDADEPFSHSSETTSSSSSQGSNSETSSSESDHMTLTDSSEEEGDELLDLFGELLEHTESTRYIFERQNIVKTADFLLNYLMELPEDRFRQHLRCTKTGFQLLYAEIRDDPIFANNSRCPQTSSAWQLAVTLSRLGANGTGSSVGRTSSLFGFGAGTCTLFMNRVMIALLARQQQWVGWPDDTRRIEIRQVLAQEGFPGCVGFIDGTTLPLSQKPALDGESYFDRKHRYSISMQVVCDSDKRITAFHVGCPGSQHDASVFQKMALYRQPALYFAPGEYLMADSAYPSLPTMVPAYKRPLANLIDNKDFNRCLAGTRVRNEHTIGILKSRWGSLQQLRLQLRTKQEMLLLVRWVSCCVILHNMLASLNDNWLELYEEAEEPPDVQIHEEGEAITNGNELREQVKHIALDFHRQHGILCDIA